MRTRPGTSRPAPLRTMIACALAASAITPAAHAQPLDQPQGQAQATGRLTTDQHRSTISDAHQRPGPYAPALETWSAQTGTNAAAAAALSGIYATASTTTDTIEIRGIRRETLWTVDRAAIEARVPWADLDAGPDGPVALAVSDSGLHVFIAIDTDQPPPSGGAADAILRLDTTTGELITFARTELAQGLTLAPSAAMAHYAGRLHLGTANGAVLTFTASAATTEGTLTGVSSIPTADPVTGMAIDRDTDTLFVSTATTILHALAAAQPTLTAMVGTPTGVQSIAWSSHYAGGNLAGLYLLTQEPDNRARVRYVPAPFAAGGLLGSLPTYLKLPGEPTAIAATACGRLLLARTTAALLIADRTDPLLTFEDWLVDELEQAITFGRGLIAPDGEPGGWVIDADVTAGGTRFHPATPDAACWAVLLLLAADDVLHDPTAQADIATILRRYAGLTPDAFHPGVSLDGIMRHWCDPFSSQGNAKPGWPAEFASFSTMKISLAAWRARTYYPADTQITDAADTILDFPVSWDAYIATGSDAVYLVSLGDRPDRNAGLNPFHEGIIYVQQAAAFGNTHADNAYARWLDPNNWPSATTLPGRPTATNVNGSAQAAFTALYPLLVTPEYRASPAWQTRVANLYASHAAWTDDNAARWFTVFSAGTTKPEFGGYNADSLTDHPGDFATFTSLMAFSADASTPPAVAAYHAYRTGARQTWATGASLLYRRSNQDPAYQPNTAGLPDVALGALALAELIKPGFLDAVLAPPPTPAAHPRPAPRRQATHRRTTR